MEQTSWVRPRARRLTAAVAVAACATLVACGGGGDDDAAPTTTTTEATTTTTAAPVEVAPLTGLPEPDAARRNRTSLVVKIDNAPRARPQAGLNAADVVVEEKVEDGVTRLFVVYQSRDADPVGPVRSARSTDIELMGPLNRPLFAYSGTNAAFQRLLDQSDIVDVGIDQVSGAYRRVPDRPAPYNLFTTTGELFALAGDDQSPPPPLFPFRADGEALAVEGAEEAGGVHVAYRGENITTIAEWQWDGGAGLWRRVQDGTSHVDAAGDQVTARNVIVQLVEYRDTGFRDQSNTVVPEAVLDGEGEAWVLTDGKVVRGRWSRADRTEVTRYLDERGEPVPLTPGRTWIELAPLGSAELR